MTNHIVTPKHDFKGFTLLKWATGTKISSFASSTSSSGTSWKKKTTTTNKIKSKSTDKLEMNFLYYIVSKERACVQRWESKLHQDGKQRSAAKKTEKKKKIINLICDWFPHTSQKWQKLHFNDT